MMARASGSSSGSGAVAFAAFNRPIEAVGARITDSVIPEQVDLA